MKITAYKVSSMPLELRPSNQKRNWMDDSNIKNAYRCLPLTIANGFGWEILSPSTFTVEWNGKSLPSDISVTKHSGGQTAEPLFGEGTFTWHTGYMFKTEYPYALYVTGPPNYPKQNIIPMSGIVETYWLPFTFTMNWQFTQPGSVTINAGEPICQIFPVDITIFDHTEAELHTLEADEEFAADYWNWNLQRHNFIKQKKAGMVKPTAWQRSYFQGAHPPDNERKCPFHIKETGELESVHKTKILVREFINKETAPFRVPETHIKNVQRLNEKET